MRVGRSRDGDRVDVGQGQRLVDRRECVRDAQVARSGAGAFDIAADDRHDLEPRSLQRGTWTRPRTMCRRQRREAGGSSDSFGPIADDAIDGELIELGAGQAQQAAENRFVVLAQ